MERFKVCGWLLVVAVTGGACELDGWGPDGVSDRHDMLGGQRDMLSVPDTTSECEDDGMTLWDNATTNTDGSVTINAWGIRATVPRWPYTLDLGFAVSPALPRYLVLHGDPNHACVSGRIQGSGLPISFRTLAAFIGWAKSTTGLDWSSVLREALFTSSDLPVVPQAALSSDPNGAKPAHMFGFWLGGVDHDPTDSLWLTRMVTPAAVASGPGPATYSYRIVPSDADGNPKVGIFGPKATVTGPATLGSGGANVSLSWSAVPTVVGVASFYAVYREASSSLNASGLVAVVSTTSYVDVGTIKTPNATATPEVDGDSYGAAAPFAAWTVKSGNPGARHIIVRYKQESTFTSYPHAGAFLYDLRARAVALGDNTNYTAPLILGWLSPVVSDVSAHYPPMGK